ncbi:MAG: VWA domain-containing protein [Chlamydiia bacterium]|nr:VWA domain-containing protein [Chlamydiia bacterium]
MTPLQSHTIRSYATPFFLVIAAYFAGRQRYIQYFPGITENALWGMAGVSSAGGVGSGMLFSDPKMDQKRRICIVLSLVLSGLGAHYGSKKAIPLQTAFRFVAVQTAVVMATEVTTSRSVQGWIARSKERFSRNQTKNHFIRTFLTPTLLVAMAFFTTTQHPKNPLLGFVGMSSAGVLGSGLLLPEKKAQRMRRIGVAVTMALSCLAVYKTLPLKAILRLTAAEAAIIVAIETITSSELQDWIIRSKEEFSRNLTVNHFIRTFGVPVLLAGTHRFFLTGLSSIGIVGGGILLPGEEATQKRRIAIAISLALSSLAAYHASKRNLKTALRFLVTQGAVVAATEVVTSKSLQDRMMQLREWVIKDQDRTQIARMFLPPALFALAALIASPKKPSLLGLAGLSSIGVIGGGILLPGEEATQKRRIAIAVSLALSALAAYYGSQKALSLTTATRFAAVEGAIVVTIEALTLGGPSFPGIDLKSSFHKARLSISAPGMVAPPRVSITFCIDTSGSMTGKNRAADVKKGMAAILDDAAIQAENGAQVRIAVVGFSDTARIICSPTIVDRESIARLKETIEAYPSGGGTDLNRGLEAAAAQAQEMAGEAFSQNTLILLTDGEVGTNVNRIDGMLKPHHIQLFAVGIGADHTKDALQGLTAEQDGFKGTYIDTTTPGVTIVGTIANIYQQVMVPFSQMELRTSQLVGGQWSINGVVSQQKEGYSYCSLAKLSEEQRQNLPIELRSDQFHRSFNLSKLAFQLVFKDPAGKEGVVSIPWKANKILDPSILN